MNAGRRFLVYFLATVIVTGLLALSPLAAQDEPTLVMSEEAAAAFAERFDTMFDGPDMSIADEIFAPEFTSSLPLAPSLDLESFKAYVLSFYEAFPDLHQETTAVILGEDRLILHVTYLGTHEGNFFGIPPTGQEVAMNGIGIFRFDENGMAVQNWAVLDVVGVLAQVGAFPPAPPEDASVNNEARRQAILSAADSLTTGDYAFLDEFLADEYVVHAPLGDMDRAALEGFFGALRNSLTGFTVERHDVIVEGNMASTRLTMSGVFENEFPGPTGILQPTGQPVAVEVINVFHFNDEGKVVEEWAQFDVLGFLTQMGAMQPPA